jgi:putative thioredoxin
MTEHITDSSDHRFMEDVIQASTATPVIVDFWAPWCGPCKQLMPALERVTKAAAGKVKLVKINIDENPGVAGQLGVRSIPAVFAFKDGQPVDGFMGPQPETELQKFVARLTGETDPVDEAATLTARAKDSLSAGDMGGAAQDFAQALQLDPNHGPAIAGLVRIYLEQGQEDAARAILDGAPEVVQADPELIAIRNKLTLAEAAPEDSELSNLEASVQASPKDLDAKLELAKAYSGRGRNADAVDVLLTSVAANRAHNNEAARLFLLEIFKAEGVESEIAQDGRRRLSSILFA